MTVMATRAIVALPKVPDSTEDLQTIIDSLIEEKKPEAEAYSFEFVDELPDDVPLNWVDQLSAANRQHGESGVYLLVYMI